MSGRSSGTRVIVRRLSYRVRERDLEKFFQKIGRVMDISMKNGYAYVEFDDYRDADDAVYELNGKELMGERVSVEKVRGTPRGSDVWRGSGRPPRDYGPPPPRRRSRGRHRDSDHRNNERCVPPTRTEYRLIVENLSSRVSWQDLKDYMRQAGEVTYADSHKQRRNQGVVEFASHSDMKNAIKRLDNTELNGRRIHLVKDKHRRKSRSSSSRSRSRSRSRDRSKSRSRSSRSVSRSRSKSPAHSRSKSASQCRTKSRLPSAPKAKRCRSRSNSIANHKRTKNRQSTEGRSSTTSLDSERLNRLEVDLEEIRKINENLKRINADLIKTNEKLQKTNEKTQDRLSKVEEDMLFIKTGEYFKLKLNDRGMRIADIKDSDLRDGLRFFVGFRDEKAHQKFKRKEDLQLPAD